MKISKQTIDKFRQEFPEAVKALEENYGWRIKLGNARFDEFHFTIKVTVTDIETDADEKLRHDFENLCHVYGFCKDDFKREFMWGLDTMELIGFNPRARKNTITIRKKRTGEEYVTSESALRQRLTRQNA